MTILVNYMDIKTKLLTWKQKYIIGFQEHQMMSFIVSDDNYTIHEYFLAQNIK